MEIQLSPVRMGGWKKCKKVNQEMGKIINGKPIISDCVNIVLIIFVFPYYFSLLTGYGNGCRIGHIVNGIAIYK